MTDGRIETIPTIIIKEIPFPIPLSVIRSPSHISNIVPVTILTIATNLNPTPGLVTTATPLLEVIDSKNIVML